MKDQPQDPHDIPLEELFQSFKPGEREAIRGLLDRYAAVAWQVWMRMEAEPSRQHKAVRTVVDIIIRDRKKNAA